jgi:hypothetical protein
MKAEAIERRRCPDSLRDLTKNWHSNLGLPVPGLALRCSDRWWVERRRCPGGLRDLTKNWHGNSGVSRSGLS